MLNSGTGKGEFGSVEQSPAERAYDPKPDLPLKSVDIDMKTASYESVKSSVLEAAAVPAVDIAWATDDVLSGHQAVAANPMAWPRISVIIPARNEALNLPHVLSRLPENIFEVILVDGKSTDDTIEVARAHWPGVRIVHETRKGKGNALACGFAAARGDIIVMLDADGSADGQEIPRFVHALLDGADVAKGSRFLSGGGSSDITHLRRMGNWVLTNLVNLLYSTTYSDLCYGYNAFWARHLQALNVDCDGFEVETLINIRIAKVGLRVTEVPSFEYSRLSGASNLHAVRDGLRVLKTIVRERQVGSVARQESLSESQATVDAGA